MRGKAEPVLRAGGLRPDPRGFCGLAEIQG